MPEGPEVACLAEELNKYLSGRILEKFDFLSGRYLKHSLPENFEEFSESFPIKIKEVEYKGKLIIFHFGEGKEEDKRWYMFNTLGMTGCWTFTQHKHSHIRLTLKKKKGENNEKINEIYFTDVRCFGTVIFSKMEDEYQSKLDSLADGFLGKYQISEEEFKKRCLKNGRKNIAKALMDQKSICSGVGNYLLSEIAYDTGINPFLKFSDLEEDDISNLYECCGRLIRSSYKEGGTSIRNYTNMEGEDGDNYYNLKVYGQEEDPQGYPIKRVTGPHGRTLWLSTSYYWVEELEKE